MDIAKYFYRINHRILLNLWQNLWLLSLSLPNDLLCGIDLRSGAQISGIGIPIGSLISQMHANFYLDPPDKFIKHELKAKCYLRYMDDMCVVSENKHDVKNIIKGALTTCL